MSEGWGVPIWRVVVWAIIFVLIIYVCFQIGEIIRQVHPMLTYLSGPVLFLLLYRMSNAYWEDQTK